MYIYIYHPSIKEAINNKVHLLLGNSQCRSERVCMRMCVRVCAYVPGILAVMGVVCSASQV